MTDISHLKVSLTKHNAHKIAWLLKKYKAGQLLDKLNEVRAEEAQAYKNLSVQPGGQIPEVWVKAKKLGDDAIDALVLIGIIFSHQHLIIATINASERSVFSGRIERGVQLGGKAYTNFVQIIDQLGYATKRDHDGVSFNFRQIFKIRGLGPLTGELLRYKLKAAQWNGLGEVADEAVVQRFHKVFGISARAFKEWLSADAQPSPAVIAMLPKDEEFFQTEEESSNSVLFQFKAGHEERSVEPISRTASAKTKAIQLHNDIQNRLYRYLKNRLGAANVGTEMDTGSGTAVDVAARQGGKMTFYEIKTGSSVRASIRQAIPQLLEYAFWPSEKRADELVIVSHLSATNASRRYMKYLREQFGLPLSYQKFDMTTNMLI